MLNFVKEILRKIARMVAYPARVCKFNNWYNNVIPPTFFIYVCVDGIGDIVWFMSFWEQYKNKHNLRDNYKILAPTRHKDMFLHYGEYNLIEDSQEFMPIIMGLWVKKKLYKYPKISVMCFPICQSKRVDLIEGNYRARIGLFMDDAYRFGCFDLSYDIEQPITLPPLARTDFEINTKKNILLIPYTRSRINIQLKIWEDIANALQTEGYTVYTNVGTPEEKAIHGTIPLSRKVVEVPAILRKYNFISLCGRCGLADWLFVNECKQLVVHSCKRHPKNRHEWLCTSVEKKDSFKLMKRKCLLNEEMVEDIWLYTDDLASDYLLNIIQKVKKLDT